MRRARWSRSAPLLIIAIVAAACGREPVRTGSEALLPTKEEPPPARVLRDTRSPAPAPTRTLAVPADPTGVLEVRVTDDRGRTRRAVTVRYTGAANGAIVTGARGVGRARVPAGAYELEIPAGCVGDLEINRGQTAGGVTVYEGRTSVVRMDGRLAGRWRWWAGTPVTFSEQPPWRRDRSVDVSFLLYDRCADRVAEARRVTPLRLSAEDGLALDGDPPRRSSRAGVVTVAVRCVAAGRGAIHVSDPDTGERADVLRRGAIFGAPDEYCV